MQQSHIFHSYWFSSPAWVVKANMWVTHTARIGRWLCFFYLLAGVGRIVFLVVMQLSHNTIMQYCRYYSVHQLVRK